MKNIFLLLFMLPILTACNQTSKTESKKPEVIQKVEITITGMSCTGCEETITKGALALEGVKEASASFKDGKAWITYVAGVVTPADITGSIEKAGYKVMEITPAD